MYQYVFDIDSRTYTRLHPVLSDVVLPEEISLLDEGPNNEYIPLLRANKSVVRPSAAYLESIKGENLNVMYYTFFLKKYKNTCNNDTNLLSLYIFIAIIC